jgi:hypothetical protein
MDDYDNRLLPGDDLDNPLPDVPGIDVGDPAQTVLDSLRPHVAGTNPYDSIMQPDDGAATVGGPLGGLFSQPPTGVPGLITSAMDWVTGGLGGDPVTVPDGMMPRIPD